jgi:hypothetical protein
MREIIVALFYNLCSANHDFWYAKIIEPESHDKIQKEYGRCEEARTALYSAISKCSGADKSGLYKMVTIVSFGYSQEFSREIDHILFYDRMTYHCEDAVNHFWRIDD